MLKRVLAALVASALFFFALDFGVKVFKLDTDLDITISTRAVGDQSALILRSDAGNLKCWVLLSLLGKTAGTSAFLAPRLTQDTLDHVVLHSLDAISLAIEQQPG